MLCFSMFFWCSWDLGNTPMSKTKGEEAFCLRGFDDRQCRRQRPSVHMTYFCTLPCSHPRTCLLRPPCTPRTSRTRAACPWRFSPTSAVRIRTVCALIGLITRGHFQAHAAGRTVVIDGNPSTLYPYGRRAGSGLMQASKAQVAREPGSGLG